MSNRGMFLKKAKPTNIQEAVWWEEYCIRRQGGYDFDGTNLPINNGWIPKGAILKKTSTGGCAVVKTAKVAEKATKSAKAIKVAKNHLLKVGDTVNGNKITAITAGDGFDTLTVGALSSDLEPGTVLTDYAAGDVILGLYYDTFYYSSDEQQAATPTLRVLECEEATLPFPITKEIKDAINANGIIRFKIQ